MIGFLCFVGITLLLVAEGALVLRLILRTTDVLLACAFGLPLAVLINVFIVFDWTILGIPLTPISILLPQVLMTAGLGFAAWKTAVISDPTIPGGKLTRSMKALFGACCVLIASTAIYSFAHAVMLPTFQYDSATNWTMRSQISFVDKQIAFDATEVRGMAKPQYPFLFHSLQITANQGQPRWNDTAANAILWLLSLSTFIAVFLILLRLMKPLESLVTVTLILGIPLLSVHLGQGYGDITMTQQLLLALACFMIGVRYSGRWLLVSGITVATSVWTKSEGLFFGLVPWLLVCGILALCERPRRKEAGVAMLTATILSVPWPIFATVKGMLLTPHSGDAAIGFHPEGLTDAFLGLFGRGSFGISWYAILIALLWMTIDFWRMKKKPWTEILGIAWGTLVFAEVLFIYLFTPNVRFLLNAESYYRQMMLPAAMLILALAVWFTRPMDRTETITVA